MKIAVIGASGRLSSKIIKRAFSQGYEVKAFYHHRKCDFLPVEQVQKDLFDMTRKDLDDVDVLVSAYGSGFDKDPKVNFQVYLKYQELLENTNKKLVVVGGAGCLYTDSSHLQYEYQSKNHPQKLKEISYNNLLGIQSLKQVNFDWVVVSPARTFDYDGPFTGKYIVSKSEEILYNHCHQSYVTYEDFAQAIIDLIQNQQYLRKNLTFVSDIRK